MTIEHPSGCQSGVHSARMAVMPHAFRSLRIPLLAALLAGPLAQRSPAVWSAETVFRGIDSPAVADSFALPTGRLQPVLYHRSPVDRQGDRPWFFLTPSPLAGVFAVQILGPPSGPCSGPLAESARHFPLFPTGPPSLG